MTLLSIVYNRNNTNSFDNPESFQPFFKQKKKGPTFTGSSFLYVWDYCHLLPFLGIHEESLDFGLDKRNYLKISLWALGTCLVWRTSVKS